MGAVNPRQVREFARAAGRLAKTDRLDAAVIAHFAETFAPRPGKPDALADRLGEHVLYRRSLQDEIVALEHQQRRLETPAWRERAERRLAALRAEVKEIEREMRAIVDGDPAKKGIVCLPDRSPLSPVSLFDRRDRFFVPTSAQRGAARRRGQDGPQATAAGGAQRS